MNNIFWGFFFIIFNFSLNFNESTISLIPTFIGYWLLSKGLRELTKESGRCTRMIPWAKGMVVYTLIIWIMDALGIGSQLGGVNIVLTMVATIIQIYISYQVVMGTKEVEDYHGSYIRADKLKSAWWGMVIASALVIPLAYIPGVNLIALIAAFVCYIVFAVALHKTKTEYELLPPVTEFISESEDMI